MQYLIYFTDANSYTVVAFLPNRWAGVYYTDISLWNGAFSEYTSEVKTIEQWLANVSNSVVLLAAESITPELIRQHPEFLI
ncbi:MAG: hypothetical protein ACYDD5_01005 [Sulfuricurvum sp.]